MHNTPTIFVVNSNALGDVAAALPVLKYCIDNFHSDGKYKIIAQEVFKPLFWFVPDENFVKIGDPVSTEGFYVTKLNLLKDDLFETISYGGGRKFEFQIVTQYVTPLRLHLVDYASIQLANRVLDLKDKNYLQYPLNPDLITKFDIDFSKTVVINTSFRSKTRRFIPEELKKICEFINQKGCKPLFVGKTETPDYIKDIGYNSLDFDYSCGIDLRDKTELAELINIIAQSKAVIGVDNGIIHLAGMTQTPIIAGYTLASPKLRLPYRNNKLGWNVYPVIPKKLECAFCQDKWQLQNHDFNFCKFEHYDCVKHMSADKFIKKLEKVL